MSSDAAARLIRALIENMKGARDDWATLAMVIDLSGGRVSGTHGYAYSADGTVSAVASRPSRIKPAVEAYLESYDRPVQAPPMKILVQLDRDSGTYEVTFEDDDPARWQVTPANIEQISEELRPDFDRGARPVREVEYAVEDRGWIPKAEPSSRSRSTSPSRARGRTSFKP